MDYTFKLLKKISVRAVFVHLIGLIVSMAVVWGISYLLLVTFSIQDNPVVIPDNTTEKMGVSTSTKNISATSSRATKTASSSKSKK